LASAQRAVLEGAVSDTNGSVVSGAAITLLNLDQGLERDAVTNGSGYYAVPLLQPGRYLVTAQKNGFAVAEVRDVILHVGEVRGLNITLQVGAAPIEIEVSGNSEIVETVSSALGDVITGAVVRNAPLDGRDIRDLALLQPGVVPSDLDYSRNGVGSFTVAGNRSDSVTYLLDGGLNNDLIDNGAVYVPNPDTVAEFRILTSNYPAEYGRNSGGVVTVATESGTNSLHGGLFEFLRNDALNANSFFNKNHGLPRDVLKRNQFGGTLGGPLTIPHLLEGKDRFFFFLGYQGGLQDQALSEHGVPTFTPAELQGNFSQAGPGNTPDAGVASFLQAYPFFQSDPTLAAQGIIDPTRINSVAQNYIHAGLIPTSPTGEINSQQRFTDNNDELTAKFDFSISAKDKLSVTSGWNRAHVLSPYDYADVPGYPDVSDFHTYFLNLAYTRIISPTLLNEAKVTMERTHNRAENPAVQLPRPQSLGVGVTPDLATGPTNLAFDNGLSIGFSVIGPQVFTDNTFSYSDALTWSHGSHNLKFGGGWSAYQNNTSFALEVNGQFVFAGNGDTFSGNSLADFLLGLPVQYTQAPAANSNIRSKFMYGFGQDDWHLRKNLVLSLGLRYEYSTPKLDRQGRTFSVVPGQQSSIFPNAPAGLLFPGDAGAPRGVNYPDHNDWAPRVGFAWDPQGNGKMSLRGAFGVFYDILKAEDNLQFNGKPPFYSSAGLQFAPLSGNPGSELNYLSDPFGAVGAQNPFPSHAPPSNIDFASAGFLPIGASGNLFVVDPHLRTPYTYQYHLTLEREIARNTVVEASYVGSSSHGLTALEDINPFVLGTYNRVLNLSPGNQTCTSATSYLCSFATVYEFRNISNADYNSLLTSLRKQFSGNGIFGKSYFTLAYTYAHNIDNASGFQNRNWTVPYYDPGLFRASADMDVRHRVVFSGGWELPFQRLSASAPKRLTEGWQIFPIVSWRTGLPLDIFANLPNQYNFADPGPTGAGDSGLVRANLVGPLSSLDPHHTQTIAGATGNFWFNPTSVSADQCNLAADPSCQPSAAVFPSSSQAVANPAVRTYGTLPRNYLRGPGGYNINLALSKSTAINERVAMEIRADFFNLFNHTEFANPDVNIGSPTFGQVLYTGQPRVIQLALRVKF
jgi:hypothetical protein